LGAHQALANDNFDFPENSLRSDFSKIYTLSSPQQDAAQGKV